MNKFVSLAAVGLLSLSAVAVAAEPQAHGSHAGHAAPTAEITPAQKEFRVLDKNQDGKLSKAEMPAKHPMAAHFAMMDTNKDGMLSEAEYTGH